MIDHIRTAIIPAGGLGTRLMPLTRAVPKELLPVWNRPVLDYAVEEAMSAGIERIVIVTAPGKEALRRHFQDRHFQDMTAPAGWHETTAWENVEIVFVEQSEPLGLGDAVRRAAPVGEPVAVLLPDELLVGPNCLRELVCCHAQIGGSVIAVQKVPRADVGRYGIIDVEAPIGRQLRIRSLVEKPQPDAAPSDLAVIGRYILDAAVIAALQNAQPTLKSEVQLTDSIAATCATSGVYGIRYEGRRFDCGSFHGLLQANLAVAELEEWQTNVGQAPAAARTDISAQEAIVA